MFIAETVPQKSISVKLSCGRGNANITRNDWAVRFGSPDHPPVVTCGRQEYVYSDGALVPRHLVEEQSKGAGRIQVGSYVSNLEKHDGWAIEVPLDPNQCGIFSYGDYSVTFNAAAAPVITWEGRDCRVFDKPIDYPSSSLSEKEIGQLIPGKGILIAPGVQFYDFTDRPVGPPLNYFLAPQTIKQLYPAFNDTAGARMPEIIAALKDVYGYDGSNIRNTFDLMRTAIKDVRDLEKWHLPPVEILAGVSEMSGEIVNPHHIQGLLTKFSLPDARYPALGRNYIGRELSVLVVALHSGVGRLVNMRQSWFDTSTWGPDGDISYLLVRAEPA